MSRIQICHLTLAIAGVTFLACAGRDSSSSDTTEAVASTTRIDSGTVAMTSNRAPSRDADQEFLRMMSDHHEGLIRMAMAAMTRASTPAAQGDAHRLHTKQLDEQKQMLAMLRNTYGETVVPMTMPSARTMNDSLESKSGLDYDRTFYANVIAHHREGIKMMDDVLSRLTKADVRQMAEKMKADQQREITEFGQKPK